MDAKLAAYLRAADEAEREQRLAELLLGTAEPLVRRTVRFRLRRYIGRDSGPDGQSVDDVCQLALAKILAWLRLLAGQEHAEGVQDFGQYAVRVAVNACYDHLRRRYPARTRLKDSVRNLLDRHRDFAVWRDERSELLAGFAAWEGQASGSAASRAAAMLEDHNALERAIGEGDPQRMPLAAVVAGLLRASGGPVELETIVEMVAALQNVKEASFTPVDESETAGEAGIETDRAEAENRIEARELLALLWQAVEDLPDKQRAVYFYSFHDEHGEDLFSLLLAYGVAAPGTIAERLGVTVEHLIEMKSALPMKHEAIAALIGAERPHVSKWIFRAREKVRARLFPILQK